MFLVGELGGVIPDPGRGSYYLRIKPIEDEGGEDVFEPVRSSGYHTGSLFPAIFRVDVMGLWNIRSVTSISTFRAVLLPVIVGLLSVSGWLQRLDWLIYDEIINR